MIAVPLGKENMKKNPICAKYIIIHFCILRILLKILERCFKMMMAGFLDGIYGLLKCILELTVSV